MSQGKCDIHGIWLDSQGKCQFCETSNPQSGLSSGIKQVGGGQMRGVTTYSKEKSGDTKQASSEKD